MQDGQPFARKSNTVALTSRVDSTSDQGLPARGSFSVNSATRVPTGGGGSAASAVERSKARRQAGIPNRSTCLSLQWAYDRLFRLP